MSDFAIHNFSEKVNFLWSIAELIRDSFTRSDYKDVILPFTVLRRIDCVLEPTKQPVLDTYEMIQQRGIKNDALLCLMKRRLPSYVHMFSQILLIGKRISFICRRVVDGQSINRWAT
jgi:hypothetical protein